MAPVLQAQGPQRPAVSGPAWHTQFLDELFAALLDEAISNNPDQQFTGLTQGLIRALSQGPITWDEGQELLTSMRSSFTDEDMELLALSPGMLDQLMSVLGQPQSWASNALSRSLLRSCRSMTRFRRG